MSAGPMHDPLGVARGARRIDKGGEVVGPHFGRSRPHGSGIASEVFSPLFPQLRQGHRARQGRLVEEHHVLEGLRLAPHLEDLPGLSMARHEADRGVAVVQDVEHLGRKQGRVDGNVDGAGGERGEVGERPFGPVLGEDGHPIALRHPERAQTHRELFDRGLELRGARVPPLAVSLGPEMSGFFEGVDRPVEDVAEGALGHHLPPRPAAVPARAGRAWAILPGIATPRRKRSTTGAARSARS